LARPKCLDEDKTRGDCHFDTWTGKERPVQHICSVSSQNPLQHVVGTTSWKAYPMSVAFRAENRNIPPTLRFDYGGPPKKPYWKRDRQKPLFVPGAPPSGSRRVTEPSIVEPDNVVNRPDQVIEVTISYRPHLPGAGWITIGKLYIQVDIL